MIKEIYSLDLHCMTENRLVELSSAEDPPSHGVATFIPVANGFPSMICMPYRDQPSVIQI